jgi:capsular exopolysaccharide synthesis family protein
MNKNLEKITNAPQEDEIDIKEIWRTIRGNRRLIVVIFSLIIALTGYVTLTTHPIYEAKTAIMIKDSRSDPSSFVFDFGISSSKQRLQNEIEILRSFNLNDKVIQSLLVDSSSKHLTLFGTRYIKRRYRLIDYFFEWIDTSPINSQKTEMTKEKRFTVINGLRKATKISTVRDTDVLKIAVTSKDSSEAVFLANRIAKIYRNQDLAGGQGELHFVLTFLNNQITQYERRLSNIENELKKFQSENQIYSLDGPAELLLKELTDYEGIYFTNLAELEVAQERIKYLKRQLSNSEKALMEEITNTNNPMIVALRGKIAELEAQKVQQMIDEGWMENSLQANDFDRRISEMKEKLTNVTESLILSGWSEEDPFSASQEIFNKIVEQEVEVYASNSRADEYKKLVNEISNRLTNLPNQTLQYARLERELKLNENLYLTMKQKYEESRITEAGQQGKVHILDPALIAEKIKPNKKMNLFLGIIFGLGLGVGIAFVKEIIDSSVKSVEQLERKGMTVLGIIPDMHNAGRKMSKNQFARKSKGGIDFKRRLITYEDPKSPISESYRSLRTNISYASPDKKIKSLLISSPQPGEGKSTTVANLAIAFAQLRKRTLLIDADLRKPVQHNVFEHQRGPGLAEYLIGEIDDFDTIIHSTKIENLFIVTAGGLPPNPSELLGSDRMSRLVAHLEEKWDMILFDSPPIVAVTDSSTISAEIDALVMVVKAGQTDRAAVDRALDTISNVRSPLIGAILNGANPETLAGKYSYYYSYYHYYYYSEDGSKKQNTDYKNSRIKKLFTKIFSPK